MTELHRPFWQESDTAFMKWVALISMIIDHAGVVFFSGYTEFRLLGRIAFPLYCWCLVIGSKRTKNPWKYALRLLGMLVISQPFYMLALGHEWWELNVFATLLLGLLAVLSIEKKWHFSQIWGPAAAILLTLFVKMDYGWRGIVLILLLYFCRNDRKTLAAVFIAYLLYWGQSSSAISTLCGISLAPLFNFAPYSSPLMMVIFRVQFFGILALPFMLHHPAKSWKMPKAVAYLSYPVHLGLIALIKLLVN